MSDKLSETKEALLDAIQDAVKITARAQGTSASVAQTYAGVVATLTHAYRELELSGARPGYHSGIAFAGT